MTLGAAKLILFAALLCCIGFSLQQEPSKLLETYNHVENLFETVSNTPKLNVQTTQTISNTQRMLVHVKIRDNTIMTDDFLNRMAQLMKVDNYKEFQFHSDIPVFTTRLTTLQIQELSNNNFAKLNIEWIKKVSNSDKKSFTKLSLDSLKLGGLKIVLDSKLNEMERLQTMNRLRNWYLSSYTQKMTRSLSKLNIQQIQQSIHNSKLAETALSTQQDETIIREFIRDQANSLFDLDWQSETHAVQVTLANFDYGVWKLIKEGKFDSPIVQSLKRREEIQKFFKMNQELEGLIEDMSSEMGQELLNYLSSDDSVDVVIRQRIHEIKNYGANQVIQNGGGSNYTYMWNNGITGASEVVSVIDTGITLGHCLFTGSSEPSTKTSVNLNYRKVVYYNKNGQYGDLTDGEGHGTHVAGTIAGYPQTLGTTVMDKNVGVAKDAKLYAVDVQAGANGGLYIGDMNTVLSNAFTNAGSKISSNSWGCGNPYDCDYDCKCYELNSDNTRGAAVTDASCMALTGTRCCHYCNLYGYDSNRVDTFLSSNDEVTVVMAAGNDGEYSTDSNLGDPSTSKNSLTVGASYAPSSYYKQFFTSRNYTVFEFENMASFSGKGPTYDNRIKPDIAAPGYSTISSLNTASCDPVGKSGTSMATPAVSGAAALVRHYLVKDNKKKLVDYNIFNSSPSQTLSGTLVKAMILHSGEVMKGFVQIGGTDLYLSQFNSPNKYNGFGRINLQNVLKIDTDSASVNRIKNILVANRYSLDANQQVDIPLKANSVTTLKVTIAWYDLPSAADTLSSVKTKKLINDISVVAVVGKKYYYGNGAITGNTLDTVNTAESIVISNLPQGNFTVKVGAKSTNKGKQAFSMVITGDVTLAEKPSAPTTIPSTGSPFTEVINATSSLSNPVVGQSTNVRCSLILILIISIINFLM